MKHGPFSGIPIGAIQLDAAHAHDLRDLLQRALAGEPPRRLRCRGIEPFVGPRTRAQADAPASRGLLLIHVPPAVAAALDDGHPALLAFLERRGGVYTPGLRRSRRHKAALRRHRCAHANPLYAPPRPADAARAGAPCRAAGPAFTFSGLFAGLGGFRLGLEAIGGACAFANEIDPYAAALYRAHFGAAGPALVEADLLDLCATRDVPAGVDVLTGGFPCQPFSARGTQEGFADERGQLYRELVRVLHHSRPKSFIFENVSGLVRLGAAGGRPARGEAGPVFATILRAFEACGYAVTWRLCDARHHVAQHRNRVFLVGLRTDLARPAFSWDWYDALWRRAARAGAAPRAVRDVLEPPDAAAVAECALTPRQWAKLRDLHARAEGGVLAARLDLDARAPTQIASYRSVGNRTSRFVFAERDGTARAVPRFVTPREAARIQGFPEGFRAPSEGEDGAVGVAHFYAGIGNAVVPPLVADIGRELVRCLRA